MQNRGTQEGEKRASGAGKKKEVRERESAKFITFLLAALSLPYVS